MEAAPGNRRAGPPDPGPDQHHRQDLRPGLRRPVQPTATWKPRTPGALTISADGQRLRRIYGEKDLLISQSLRLGAFSDLDAAEVAALASVLVYQAKREDRGLRPRMPSVSLESAVDIVVREWSALEDVEEQNKLPLTGEPELGLVWPMYKWAKGRHLQDVLSGTDLAAGDFVRWVKQVIDLLDQLAKIPGLDPRLARLCAEAIKLVTPRRRRLLHRGLTAAAGPDRTPSAQSSDTSQHAPAPATRSSAPMTDAPAAPAERKVTLYRNGSVYTAADPFATAMLVDGDTVAWVGSEQAATSIADCVHGGHRPARRPRWRPASSIPTST